MYKAGMLGKKADSPFKLYTFAPGLLRFTQIVSEIFRRIFKGNDYWLFYIPLI